MAGFWVWHNVGGIDGAFTGLALQGAGLMHSAYLMLAAKYEVYFSSRETAGNPVAFEPLEKSYSDLNKAPNGFTSLRGNVYQSTVKEVKERDPRLQQWAYAVAYNNAPMTQKKWCGGKRLFSKPEYERWISCLLEKEIIAFVNPKNPVGGYKPNGAAGWQTIKDISDGRDYIPLPAAVLSQEQIRFVSARLRAGVSVGEGMD